MNALPCINTLHADSHADERGREEAREQAVEARAEQLQVEMWQDLSELSDAFDDVAYKMGQYRSAKDPNKRHANHPKAATFLTLIRDGSDDLELARMLRAEMRDYISDTAGNRAEEEMGG